MFKKVHSSNIPAEEIDAWSVEDVLSNSGIRIDGKLPLTGYIRGGCSPIGMKKHFPTYIHQTAESLEQIYVSAGQRGLQVRLAPADLLREAKATWADLV